MFVFNFIILNFTHLQCLFGENNCLVQLLLFIVFYNLFFYSRLLPLIYDYWLLLFISLFYIFLFMWKKLKNFISHTWLLLLMCKLNYILLHTWFWFLIIIFLLAPEVLFNVFNIKMYIFYHAINLNIYFTCHLHSFVVWFIIIIIIYFILFYFYIYCIKVDIDEFHWFYYYFQFADSHPRDIEELWGTLCQFWPNNLKVILRYLVIISGMAPNELLPYVSVFLNFVISTTLKFN